MRIQEGSTARQQRWLPARLRSLSLTRFTPLLLIAITALGGLLRLYRVGDKNLWLDEAFSVWMSSHTLPDLFGWLVRIDQHPPLYYTLLHFWLWFGDGAGQVRTLSALLGTLTIPVVYAIGRRLSGPSVGLIAALILALSPFHVRFAQETRMYTLLTLTASLALLALTHLLTDPRAATTPMGRQLGEFVRGVRWRWPPVHAVATDLAWLGFMIFTAATLLSHNTAVFFPVAINIFVFGLMLWQRLQRNALHSRVMTGGLVVPSLSHWLWAQTGVFLLWSPWLIPFVIQSMGVYREFWIPPPTWAMVAETQKTFVNAFLPSQISWDEWIWSAFGLLALLGLLQWRKRPAVALLLLALFVLPQAGEWLVSLRRPLYYDRTLIWVTIPLYLLLAAGVARLRFRPLLLVSLILIAAIAGLSLRNYYTNFEKEEWREAAAYVAYNAHSDDLVLFNATWVQIPFDYYFRSANLPVAEHGVPVDLFDRGILEPKMAASDLPRLRSLIRDRDRVWLVYSHDWYTDPEKLIPVTLLETMYMVERRQFFGVEVRLYQAR